MLAKLIKYDLRNVYKPLIIFYLLGIFFSLLTRGFLAIEDSFIMNTIGKICSGVTISMIFNILINNILRMWARFIQNLYGDESYLVHTLPAKRSEVYLAKSLAAVITFVTSFAVILLTLFAAYYSKDNMEILKNFLSTLASGIDSTATAFALILFAEIFVQLLSALFCGFAGIVLGHRRNSGKVGWSVILGFAIYMASQTAALGIFFIFALINPDIMNLFTSSTLVTAEAVKGLLIYAIPTYAVLGAATATLGYLFFKKGVNVD